MDLAGLGRCRRGRIPAQAPPRAAPGI